MSGKRNGMVEEWCEVHRCEKRMTFEVAMISEE